MDLKVLYDNDTIVPGLVRACLPWGLTIDDVVGYLRDHPTLHVDDIIRRILLDPKWPRGTRGDYEDLAACLFTAEATFRAVAQICATTLRPVLRVADRNDRTRVPVELSLHRMFDNQLGRPNVPGFKDARRVPGPLRNVQIDLTSTADDDDAV